MAEGWLKQRGPLIKEVAYESLSLRVGTILCSHAGVTAVIAMVGFILLFYLEHTYGNVGGNTQGNLLASGILALLTSGIFAIGLAFLLVGLTRMRQEHIAWYKSVLLQGVGYILLSFGFLILIGFFNRLLSRPLALALSLLCVTLGLACAMWAIGVSQAKRRR